MGTFLVAVAAIVLLAIWAGVLIVRVFLGLVKFTRRVARF